MIKRQITTELVEAASEYPVVTILGPRQSGKTTLARMTFPDHVYRSLEDPDTRALAEADPRAFLKQMDGGGILDEVQRVPELLSYIQGIVDDKEQSGQFILTGSHQPRLHEAVSQSLAGRTALLTLWPFSFQEIKNYTNPLDAFQLINTGCYPRLHQKRLKPDRFYGSYIQTYVERDVRSLIQLRNLSQFQVFLTLLAGRIGQLVNYQSLGNEVGVSRTTIRDWMNVLKASFILYDLQPYHQNISKRLVKSPKIYFTDIGLAAYLLQIRDKNQAFHHPTRGSLYENLVLNEIIKGALNKGIRPELYFYRDTNGNEIDCLIREGGKLYPVEIKSGSTFTQDYLSGLKHFEKLSLPHTMSGWVLYNGVQGHHVQGVTIDNPLHLPHLWNALTNQ